MAKGRQREVPETLHNSAWAWDFFNVTTHILPSWTASYKISSKTLLQNRALSYRDVGNAFRNELQDAEATKGRVARGAFSASYAGEDPQDDEGDAHIIEALTAHKFNSYSKRAPLTGEAIRWHSRLGHPGPQALEHLVSASQGVRIRGPTTAECDACGLSKVKRQVRRAPRQQPGQAAGERIAVDFHDYEEGIDGYTSQMLLTCRATGYIWDYYLTARTADAIITAFKAFLGHMERQHSLKVRVIECDNEITEVKPKVGDFLRDRAIILEPSAPHTQAQNGGAERSGGVIKDKERAMRTGAKLPHQLWPEIGRTAVYLYNRTPSYRSGWKTPYDQLHTASAKLRRISQPKKQPDQTHLRAFGCKAYAMTSEAQQKVNRKMRLKPKGWIGFLVGYRSSNIYRIWIPTINRIVNTRDVIFNEDEICNGDWEQFKDDLLEADLSEIAKFAQESALPDQDSLEELEAEDSFEITLPIGALTDDEGTQLGEADETIEHIGELGYEQVPHEPCCFKKEGILFFFYVDDVIVAYRKARGDKANELINQLQLRYKLTGGNPVQWFLGMEVIRDRPARKIWLSQTAYIDKIANLANKGTATVPMTQTELRPRIGLATPAGIQRYQRKVGSVLYIAVNTRPDIAFAVSRLARFLTNPGRAHQEAADRVIHYLTYTKHRALAFGGPGGLKVASDASFADNTLDRKSSQAYTIKLFNGLIGWRASKQDTVTTSTTEAELLALAQAAKESLYVSRLLKELTVQLDDSIIQIDCDNTQTINLVTAEIATLKTKLRHVDIHNHWLRQEVQGGKIQVKYTKSTDMIADGLTKALPAGKWDRFLYQLGLEDIQERQQNRKQEGIEERLQNTEDCL
ncbi:hypothetical protein HZS61_008037 [Fusarium oxysporum f. sp. conglutinans]|uniref:Integrase catalytic domain-containing protein n=1 Tax=Fusarium oxysporum f. sp. conglutinans TaxID=100902 RepID=A0A8H6LR55_FUSOX|nr:hypothetical protein HZS61_008037 [Fusarium oxysporum f. sp. conglutinans]